MAQGKYCVKCTSTFEEMAVDHWDLHRLLNSLKGREVFDTHYCSRCQGPYEGDISLHTNQLCVFYAGCPKCGEKYVRQQHVLICKGKVDIIEPLKPHANLALRRPVLASSVETTGFEPENAVDGNPLKRWSSRHFDPQWIEVELEHLEFINKVKIHWEIAYARSYEIQVSRNGMAWTTLYATDHGKGGMETITFKPVRARWVKVYCKERATQWGHSIWTLEVTYDPTITASEEELKPKVIVDTRPIPEQVRSSPWWNTVHETTITIVDERKLT